LCWEKHGAAPELPPTGLGQHKVPWANTLKYPLTLKFLLSLPRDSPREANPGLFTQDRCVYHVSDLCWNSNLQAFEENKNSAISCLSGMSGRILRTSAVATKVVVVIVVDHNGAWGGVVVIVIVVVDCAAQHTSSTLKTKRAVDSATEHISQTLQHKKKR
jgi:hypothetical protein